MGLDHGINKKHYIGGAYSYRKVTGDINLVIDGKPCDIKVNQIDTIVESVVVWRKENHFHKWFVDNVQDYEDDCKTYGFYYETLIELKSICEEVLDNPELAEDLLPTQQGFFFGGTDYSEYYFDSLKAFISFVNTEIDDNNISYEYWSSW